MSPPERQLLSTGQVARLLSVTPDTVLKWIRRGRIPAVRTAGGHHRIDAADIATLLDTRCRTSSYTPGASHRLRCWEYLYGPTTVRSNCKDCPAYRFRAARCFEVRQSVSPKQDNSFCATGCRACPYYLRAHGEPQRVLVITTDHVLGGQLVAASGAVFDFRTAASSYQAGAMVAEFSPGIILIDELFDPAGRHLLLTSLSADPHIPWARVVLLYRSEKPGPLPPEMHAALPASFRVADLAPLARLEPVEASAG